MSDYRCPSLWAATALLLAGCAGPPELAPAPGAQQTSGITGAAYDTDAKVRIVAAAPRWPGSYDIRSEVTPLRLVVENNSDRPITIEYDNLRLVAANGAVFSALPLYRIEGTVEKPVTVRDYTPLDDPGFVGDDFAVAPFYDGIYPGTPVHPGPFYYDSGYHDAYDTYFVETQLPTGAMRQFALPEGVLGPGGRVEGWVYFERVPEDSARVNLRVDIEHAETGRAFAEMRIPFVVGS